MTWSSAETASSSARFLCKAEPRASIPSRREAVASRDAKWNSRSLDADSTVIQNDAHLTRGSEFGVDPAVAVDDCLHVACFSVQFRGHFNGR